jgi:hypothetical protein
MASDRSATSEELVVRMGGDDEDSLLIKRHLASTIPTNPGR